MVHVIVLARELLPKLGQLSCVINVNGVEHPRFPLAALPQALGRPALWRVEEVAEFTVLAAAATARLPEEVARPAGAADMQLRAPREADHHTRRVAADERALTRVRYARIG